MIDYYSKVKGRDEIKKDNEFTPGCWINVLNPNDDELNFLASKFELSKENLIDGIDIHESSRFETENGKVYVYLTAPAEKIEHEYDSSFLVIYSKEIFITISRYPLEILDEILSSKKIMAFSNPINLLRIMFFISHAYEKSVQKIIKEIKTNRANLDRLKNKDIAKLISNEDRLNEYISSFGSMIQTYNRTLRDKSLKFIKKDEETIKDLIIDMDETLNLCKQTLKTISNMRNYYSTKLSNDLAKTVSVLTLFTISLSIPTLFSSIYGMNVALPFQNSSGLLLALAGLVIGIWILMFAVLRRYKII